MLTTAVRRAATLALPKHGGETREILDILAQHSTAVAVMKPRSRKIPNKKADIKRKARAKTEEQTLSWWLDQGDLGDLFRVLCYTLHLGS
jgi:hypothetical protein